MEMYSPRDTPRQALEQDVEALVRRVTVESQKLGHAFADLHQLHETDFEALIHVMDAEGRGEPITPGRLATALALSSGATSAVIDRLEKHDFVRRDRDDADRRRVHLRYSDRGAFLAVQFFGGLRGVFDDVMTQFSDEELASVHRFMTLTSDAMAHYRPGPRTAI